MGLVTLPEPLHDLESLLHRRLRYDNRLETTLEGRVLLDVLAVLVQRGGANALQLTPGKGRLENVGGIDCSLGGSGADQGVDLINHENDVVVLLDLVHELLEPLLELSPVLGSRDEQAHVQGHDLLALDGLRHVAAGDALSESLGDGGLTDTWLSNQARVILGTTAQNLGDALNLLGTAHDRVQASLLGALGEVGSVLLERRRLVGPRCAPSGSGTHWVLGLSDHADHLRPDLLRVGPERLEHPTGHSLTLTKQAEQNVLGADVVVAQLARLLEGKLQHALGARRERDLHGDEAASAPDHLLDLHTSILQSDAHGLEHLGGDTCI